MPASIALVREFYTNLKGKLNSNELFVRCVLVDFSPVAINSHLRIQEVVECEYTLQLTLHVRVDYDLLKE